MPGLISAPCGGGDTNNDVALARSLHRGGGFMWKALAILVALLATLVFVDTISHSEEGNEVSMALQLVLIAVGVLAFAFLFPRTWRPREIPGYKVERTVTREGIYVHDWNEPRFILWKHVAHGRRSDGIGIIYTGGTSTAYIFPRRMFSCQEDWCCFCEILDIKALAI